MNRNLGHDLDLDARRRRIRYRAWHRGLRELELLLGPFADAESATLDETDVTAFEALLEADDQTVLGWLMGDAPPDAAYDTPLFRRMRASAG